MLLLKFMKRMFCVLILIGFSYVRWCNLSINIEFVLFKLNYDLKLIRIL